MKRRTPGSPRPNTISPLLKRTSRNAAAQASISRGSRPPNRSVLARSGMRTSLADMQEVGFGAPATGLIIQQAAPRSQAAMRPMGPDLCNAVERGADARRTPLARRRRRGARIADIGSLPGPHDDLLPTARYGDLAAFNEHAENASARAGEELCAAHRDQAERAAD